MKPLTWKGGNDLWWVAEPIPENRYYIEKLGKDWAWSFCCEGGVKLCESENAGKSACESHWQSRLASCLEVVEALAVRMREENVCQLCGCLIGDTGLCDQDCDYDGISIDEHVAGSVKVRRYRETVIREMLSEEVR